MKGKIIIMAAVILLTAMITIVSAQTGRDLALTDKCYVSLGTSATGIINGGGEYLTRQLRLNPLWLGPFSPTLGLDVYQSLHGYSKIVNSGEDYGAVAPILGFVLNFKAQQLPLNLVFNWGNCHGFLKNPENIGVYTIGIGYGVHTVEQETTKTKTTTSTYDADGNINGVKDTTNTIIEYHGNAIMDNRIKFSADSEIGFYSEALNVEYVFPFEFTTGWYPLDTYAQTLLFSLGLGAEYITARIKEENRYWSEGFCFLGFGLITDYTKFLIEGGVKIPSQGQPQPAAAISLTVYIKK